MQGDCCARDAQDADHVQGGIPNNVLRDRSQAPIRTFGKAGCWRSGLLYDGHWVPFLRPGAKWSNPACTARLKPYAYARAWLLLCETKEVGVLLDHEPDIAGAAGFVAIRLSRINLPMSLTQDDLLWISIPTNIGNNHPFAELENQGGAQQDG